MGAGVKPLRIKRTEFVQSEEDLCVLLLCLFVFDLSALVVLHRMAIREQAMASGLVTYVVCDAGRTQIAAERRAAVDCGGLHGSVDALCQRRKCRMILRITIVNVCFEVA